MRSQYKPKSNLDAESTALSELAIPCQARPSGAMRVAVDDRVDVGAPLSTMGREISRPNSPVLVQPTIVVDANYSQAVSSAMRRIRAHRRNLILTALGAFMCGALTLPLTAKLMDRTAEHVSAPKIVKHAGASLSALPAPMSALPDAAPPTDAQMDREHASRQVHEAQALRSAGSLRDARRILLGILKHRPGHPPTLAAMAELELDAGQPIAAVRWAKLAVRALPSAEHGELLNRACSRAGLVSCGNGVTRALKASAAGSF